MGFDAGQTSQNTATVLKVGTKPRRLPARPSCPKCELRGSEGLVDGWAKRHARWGALMKTNAMPIR